MASGSADIRMVTDTLTRTTVAAIHTGTGITVMDHRLISGRHSTGTAAIEFITHGTIGTIITGAGNQGRQKIFEAGG